MLNNNKYHLILLVLLFVLVGSCKKKTISPDQQEIFLKYYGGANDQNSGNVETTSDGGYVLVGSTSSKGNGGYDIYVVKTDAYGNEEWSKTIGGVGNDEGKAIRTSSDGGYVVLGSLQDKATGKTNVYFIKLSIEGNVQWKQEYGDVSYSEKGVSFENAQDGGYVLIGTTNEVDLLKNGGSGVDDVSDVYLIKVSSNGTFEWEDIYGFNSADEGTGIQQISSDTYVSSGYSIGSPAVIQPDGFDMLVVKGRLQVGNLYTPNLFVEKSSPISETSIASTSSIKYLGNNEIVVLGNTTGANSKMFLLKIDINTGNKIWYKTFGGSSTNQSSNFSTTSDGGYIVTGYAESTTGNLKDIYIVKLNSLGISEWEKTYGGDGDDRGVSVKQTSDGGYIISGNISFGGSGLGSNQVMTLIKTNSKGEISTK